MIFADYSESHAERYWKEDTLYIRTHKSRYDDVFNLNGMCYRENF